MSPRELKQFVRFALSNLSAQNGHHEFELLSFELARLRVASNLMQATGPVGAGGDEGRDFESYVTHLAKSLGSGSFVARVSSQLVVGACTLQRKAPKKISEDLEKIFSQGQRPDLVVYFCEENVPIGKRHALQRECSEQFKARLEIFDGESIANELIAEDTRWIAQTYLSVNGDLFDEATGDERYAKLRQKWLTGNPIPQNLSDFLEVREGLRSSSFDASAKRDVESWLALMRPLAEASGSAVVTQRARYELIMATIRRSGSLGSVIEVWHRYFEGVSKESTPNEIADACALFTHSYGAFHSGDTTLSDEDVRGIASLLEGLIDGALGAGPKEDDRAILLQARVILSPFASLFAGESEAASFNRMFASLQAFVRQAKNTPFFPTVRLGQMFRAMAPSFGSDARFRELNAEVDRLVSEGTAAAEVADRARKRALEHYRKGECLAALDEFHRVRIAWFNHDGIEGSVLAMLLLAEVYFELRLFYAARYYASGALFLATLYPDDNIRRLASKAAFQVASSYYRAGEAFGFLYAASRALEVHSLTAVDADQWDKHEHLQCSLTEVAILRASTRILAPAVLEIVDEAIGTFQIAPQEIAALREISETPPWGTMSKAYLEERIKEDVGLNPFADVGEQMDIVWASLGIKWRIRHAADSSARLAALELATALQIIQADLAALDLAIIPSNVELFVRAGDVVAPNITPVEKNTECAWNITMPADASALSPEESAVHAVAVALVVLRSVSALPSEALEELVKRRFESGLSNRTVAVRPIRELIELAPLDDSLQGRLRHHSRPRFEVQLDPIEGPEIGWRTGPGLNYSPERAKEALRRRYRYFSDSIRLTLPRLLADDRSRETIAQMRRDGMLDWQILGLLAQLIMQWQDEFEHGRPDSEAAFKQMRERLNARAQREELEQDPSFDLEGLNEGEIKARKFMQFLAVLVGWGLENRRRTPDGAAIKRLLDERYGNSTDDILHEDPFPGINVPEISTRRMVG